VLQYIHAQPQRHFLHGIQSEIAAHAHERGSSLVAEKDQDCGSKEQSDFSVRQNLVDKPFEDERREDRHRQWEEERKREEEERGIAEEHKRKAELVTELIRSWEEAARLREFMKAIEKETVRSDFSEVERNDIQQVVEWIRQFADTLDPLSDLPEAIEEFVRHESKYW
jgi:hypothetical protein